MPMIAGIEHGRECWRLALAEWMAWGWVSVGNRYISYRSTHRLYFSGDWGGIGADLYFHYSPAFSCFIICSYWRLRIAPRVFEYQLALGSVLFISLQAIINMGVVTGLLPTKGISLPFISYGGSNLLVTFIFLGWVVNVFRKWDSPQDSTTRIMRKIVIACGGTGLTPGIALAQSLDEQGEDSWLFISRKMVDSRLSEKYSTLSFVPMPGATLIRTPLGILRFLREFWSSFIKSLSFFKKKKIDAWCIWWIHFSRTGIGCPLAGSSVFYP